MEIVKQIIYRDSDGALMIIADNAELAVIPRFYNDLTEEQKTILEDLRTFVLTHVADVKYVVYTTEGNTLDLESTQDENVRLEVSNLGDDKPVVDAVGVLCTTLLNS